MRAILGDPRPMTASPQAKAKASQLVVEKNRIGLAVRQRETGDRLVVQLHLAPCFGKHLGSNGLLPNAFSRLFRLTELAPKRQESKESAASRRLVRG